MRPWPVRATCAPLLVAPGTRVPKRSAWEAGRTRPGAEPGGRGAWRICTVAPGTGDQDSRTFLPVRDAVRSRTGAGGATGVAAAVRPVVLNSASGRDGSAKTAT